jgi:hypothetical protein
MALVLEVQRRLPAHDHSCRTLCYLEPAQSICKGRCIAAAGGAGASWACCFWGTPNARRAEVGPDPLSERLVTPHMLPLLAAELVEPLAARTALAVPALPPAWRGPCGSAFGWLRLPARC